MKPTLFSLILVILGLTVCDNSYRKCIAPLVNTISSKTGTNHSIVYNNASFPVDNTLTTKVLTVGTFHDNEVWDNADQRIWFGLFQGKEGFYLAETKLRITRVNDAVVDENENDKTGWEIRTVNKDTSIILIEPLNYLTPHRIQQAVLSKEQIPPGDSLLMNYLGTHYKIWATGTKKRMQD
jgi:hypothetical protein